MAKSRLVLDGRSLSPGELVRAARDPSVEVAISSQARQRVAACRKLIDRAIAQYVRKYRDGTLTKDDRIYGVTTGFGELKRVNLAPEELLESQRNILLSHATGVGDDADSRNAANYFPAEVVRAALIIRVNAFLKGLSGVRVELVEYLLRMINAGVVPLVPTRGSLGSSGDLCPLSHLFVVMLKEGRFCQIKESRALHGALDVASAKHGKLLSAAVGSPPPELSYKEGLALTNGATFSAALLCLAVVDAQYLVDLCDQAAALTLEAICGRTKTLDQRVHKARAFRGQAISATNMRAALHGSKLADVCDDVQDAYSVRCAPQVHGASRDAIEYARQIAAIEINSATDNPLFVKSPAGAADAHSAGNFHGQPVGMAADFICIALAELANISERRIQMLLDAHHNRGLPGNLTPHAGLNSGYMIAQYTAAALVSENKTLAHPASVDSIPSSANVEDHVAMATWACRKSRMVLANVQAVLAIELLVAVQAVEMRVGADAGRLAVDPNRPFFSVGAQERTDRDTHFVRAFERGTRAAASQRKVAGFLGGGTREIYAWVRRVVPTMTRDRVIADEIAAVREALTGSGQSGK